MSRRPKVILLDLGGVIVQLTGIALLVEWSEGRIPRDAVLNAWIRSPAVRRFETGTCTPEEFVPAVIADLELSVDEDEFRTAFNTIPSSLFPGAIELIGRLRSSGYTVAALSNTNSLHWTILTEDLQLLDAFDRMFASHLIGLIKPDADAYEFALCALECDPGDALFFDDNLGNVEGARSAGLRAWQARSPAEVEQILCSERIIP